MQHSEIIKEIITSYHPLSGNSAEKIIDFVEVQSIDQGDTFIRKDSNNDFDYFQVSGISRSFIVNQKGEEVTISFFQDQTVLTPNVARTFNKKSTLNFEALTNLTLARFKAIDLVYLMREISEVRNFANAVLQKELILKSNKELYNASFSAKERLLRFREQFDSLENLIPHPLIASYLGITNISLSRLRKEIKNS